MSGSLYICISHLLYSAHKVENHIFGPTWMKFLMTDHNIVGKMKTYWEMGFTEYLNVNYIKYYHMPTCKKATQIFWWHAIIRDDVVLKCGVHILDNHHILWVHEKKMKIHQSDS